MKTLALITARKGSKGIPGKNKKLLAGKPLIVYTIEAALEVFNPSDIIISTDDEEIISLAAEFGLKPPFIRPASLASDESSSRDVILHALDFSKEQGKEYENIVLLQPTSPFRTARHIREAMELFKPGDDMVVSVTKSDSNPYYDLYEENAAGLLNKSKDSDYTRRQDCPAVFSFNGAVYVIKSDSIRNGMVGKFNRIRKYMMGPVESLDIDTPLDWLWAEFLIEKKLVNP